VLRLASLLWRLRRATTTETGLFQIQADHLREYRRRQKLFLDPREAQLNLNRFDPHSVSRAPMSEMEAVFASATNSDDDANTDVARCFLRLANLPNFALDRLSRYEANLWRQLRQILFVLDRLDRRKPQERARAFRYAASPEFNESRTVVWGRPRRSSSKFKPSTSA
jgi:hypothetical protein